MLGASRLIKTACMGVAAAAVILGATTSADARHWRHHHHGGWGWAGPAFVGGLALGALATPRYYYGPPCHTERRVYHTRSGRHIVRYVRVCY